MTYTSFSGLNYPNLPIFLRFGSSFIFFGMAETTVFKFNIHVGCNKYYLWGDKPPQMGRMTYFKILGTCHIFGIHKVRQIKFGMHTKHVQA